MKDGIGNLRVLHIWKYGVAKFLCVMRWAVNKNLDQKMLLCRISSKVFSRSFVQYFWEQSVSWSNGFFLERELISKNATRSPSDIQEIQELNKEGPKIETDT